ncbi:SdrD B-like domain-containing protein [Persicobacter diffluens]|uniref:SD-repeat containing protein B domain-containing protein n=1 Tax=Persicobacter diffluens TaxID=981 RepID=A0AAN5ALE0_9BACT|nr:hypothetical protein PEDI_32940 [Persicobacter diffluens]
MKKQLLDQQKSSNFLNLFRRITLLILIGVFIPHWLYSQGISGVVYKDFNMNGLQEVAINEPGIEGVTVEIFDSNGLIETLVSDSNGAFSSASTNDPLVQYRVIFSGFESYQNPVSMGANPELPYNSLTVGDLPILGWLVQICIVNLIQALLFLATLMVVLLVQAKPGMP